GAGRGELGAFSRGVGGGAAQREHRGCLGERAHGLLIARLLEGGLPVYPVPPQTVERLRKPSGAKTDQIDAYLLARKGRSDLADLRRLVPDSPLVQELKLLTRDQDSLIQLQTRLVNQLTACLTSYFPGPLLLFTKLQQPVTLAFLHAFPTLEQARAASLTELETLLRAAHDPHPAAKAEQLHQQLQQPQLHAAALVTRVKARLALVLVNQLAGVVEQIAAYDAEIARLFAQHTDAPLFASLPGTGKRLAPRLLAEWGEDRSRYATAASVQALGGTSPVAFQ